MVAFFPLSLEVFRSRQLHFFSALLVHYSTLAYDQMMSNFIIEGSTDTISGSLSPWPFCNLIKIHNEISKSFFSVSYKIFISLTLDLVHRAWLKRNMLFFHWCWWQQSFTFNKIQSFGFNVFIAPIVPITKLHFEIQRGKHSKSKYKHR